RPDRASRELGRACQRPLVRSARLNGRSRTHSERGDTLAGAAPLVRTVSSGVNRRAGYPASDSPSLDLASATAGVSGTSAGFSLGVNVNFAFSPAPSPSQPSTSTRTIWPA